MNDIVIPTDYFSTISEFVEIITSHAESAYQGCWYRGVNDSECDLVPQVLWKKIPISRENTMCADFMDSAPGLADIKPTDALDWYVTMQHFGIPTRLLDWTASALIALYFALEKPKKDKQPTVWVLQPAILNLVLEGDLAVYGAGVNRDSFNKFLPDTIVGVSVSEEEESLMKDYVSACVFSFIPRVSNQRISAQKGRFTLHGRESIPINKIQMNSDITLLRKINLNEDVSTSRLLSELSILGLAEDDIYQDLPSLARRIIYSTEYI